MRILDTAKSVAVSDDGKAWSIETVLRQDMVKDLFRNQVLFKLPACREPALSHDGSFVVAALYSGEIAFFRTTDGQRLGAATIPLPPVTTTLFGVPSAGRAHVASLLVSGDDKRVVAVTSTHAAHVIDAVDGKLVTSFPFDGDLLGIDKAGTRALGTKRARPLLSLNPNGWFVVDLANGKVLRRYEPKPRATRSPNTPGPEPSHGAAVVLSSDGKTVFAKESRELWAVDVATGAARKVWEKPSTGSGGFGSVEAVGRRGFARARIRATPSGGVAFVDETGTVEWSPGTDSLRHLGSGAPLAFSPSGEVAALYEGRAVELAGHATPDLPRGHSSYLSSLSFLAGGSVLASGANDLRLWHVPSGAPIATTSSHGEIRRLAGSADGTTLLVQGEKLRVVAASGRLDTLDVKESVSHLDIDATGRRVALAFDHRETGSGLAVTTHGAIGPLIHVDGTIKAMAFSPSGAAIASLEHDTGDDEQRVRVVIRDAAFLDTKSTIEAPAISHYDQIDFAGDDRRLIVSHAWNGAVLFDLETRVPLRRFAWMRCCESLAVSRDGKYVAGSSEDKVILWDAGTRELLQVFRGHAARVNALAFSPDNRILASGSADTTVLMWDVSRIGTSTPGYRPHEIPGPATARSISRGSAGWFVSSDGKPRILASRLKAPKLDGVRELASTNLSTCALCSDGKVSCWGGTHGGAIGIPEERVKSSVKDRGTPVQLAKIPEAETVRLARHYGCALTTSGSVWCWGTPSGATLSPAETTPHEVPGTSGSVSLAVSSAFACVARQDGKVACWGSPRSEPFPVSASPAVVQGVQDATAIAAGGEHACALRRDGRVLCWGSNEFDQLGNGIGLGSVVPVQVRGVATAVQLDASSDLTCARTDSAAVWCWGRPSSGVWPGIPEPEEIPYLAGSTDLRVSDDVACGDTAAGLRCIQVL